MIITSKAEWDEDRWPNFTFEEMKCRETHHCKIDADALDALQELRRACNFPFIISSAYRDPEHPIEAAKAAPGPHTTGRAFDIIVYGKDALDLVYAAIEMGWTGIGVKQHGDIESRFIHIDRCNPRPQGPRPHIWSYR